jgi:hypothetical protein
MLPSAYDPILRSHHATIDRIRNLSQVSDLGTDPSPDLMITALAFRMKLP